MKRSFLPAALTAVDAANLLVRWLLGGLFIYMGWQKVVHPVLFLNLLREYHMVQNTTALNCIAIAVPWFEVFCGLLLIAGIAVRGTALLLAGMQAPRTHRQALAAMP